MGKVLEARRTQNKGRESKAAVIGSSLDTGKRQGRRACISPLNNAQNSPLIFGYIAILQLGD